MRIKFYEHNSVSDYPWRHSHRNWVCSASAQGSEGRIVHKAPRGILNQTNPLDGLSVAQSHSHTNTRTGTQSHKHTSTQTHTHTDTTATNFIVSSGTHTKTQRPRPRPRTALLPLDLSTMRSHNRVQEHNGGPEVYFSFHKEVTITDISTPREAICGDKKNWL